jgi:hemerythrin
VVAVDEKQVLRDYGYTHVHIHYNIHSTPLEIAL